MWSGLTACYLLGRLDQADRNTHDGGFVPTIADSLRLRWNRLTQPPGSQTLFDKGTSLLAHRVSPYGTKKASWNIGQ